jgi:hypothetical protein
MGPGEEGRAKRSLRSKVEGKFGSVRGGKWNQKGESLEEGSPIG